MFYADAGQAQQADHIVLHMVDECIKWTVALEIAGKETGAILDAMTMHWLRLYGAPDVLIWDGEGAMDSE